MLVDLTDEIVTRVACMKSLYEVALKYHLANFHRAAVVDNQSSL